MRDLYTELMQVLKAAPRAIEPGRFARFGGPNKPFWCLLFEDRRAAIYGDWRNGSVYVWKAHSSRPETAADRARIAQETARAMAARQARQAAGYAKAARHIADLLAESRAVCSGDPVARYLVNRGLVGVPVPPCIRLHPGLPYWNDEGELQGTYPAMLAPLVAPNGVTVALHRTYLSGDGCKAPVATPKKLTAAAGPLAGACTPLYGPRAADRAIGVAEGIETALAAAAGSGMPAVAAYSAWGLATYEWPPGLRRLVIFGDNDDAGRNAADKLTARATRAGLHVEAVFPRTPGADWADVWASRDQKARAEA